MNLTDANGNPYSTTTGSDGSFSFVVDPGAYSVDIENSVVGNSETITGNVDLSASQIGQVLAFPALDPLHWVVTDSNGSPLSGASVSVSPSPGSCTAAGSLPSGLSASFQPTNATLTTDSTGTATLLAAPCGGINYTAQVSAAGYVTKTAPPATIGGPTSIAVSLAATPPTTLVFSGVVEDTSGQPVSGATVSLAIELFSGASTYRAVLPATSDVNGNFSIGGITSEAGPAPIAHSDYQLVLTVNGVTFSTPYNHKLTSNVTGIVLTAPTTTPPVPASFTVAVAGPGGAPIVGANVTIPSATCDQSIQLAPGFTATNPFSFGGMQIATDASGNATLGTFTCPGGITSTPYIHIQPPAGSGFAEEYVPMPTSWSGNVNVPVVDASLTGSIVDSAGTPLGAQSITLANKSGATVATGATNTSGNFALTAGAGTYTVILTGTVGDPTLYKVAVPKVKIAAAENARLTLPVDVVHLEVTGPSGSVANATVTAACSTKISFPIFGGTAKGTECLAAVTDGSGNATLTLLPGTSVKLVVTPPAGSPRKAKTLSIKPINGISLVATLR